MPSWLRDFLGGLSASGRAALQWLTHANTPWENWVDSMLHQLWRDIMQAYILLTYDIANFSYYVGSYTAHMNKHLNWIRYTFIPWVYWRAAQFMLHRVALERNWRIKADKRIVTSLTRLIRYDYDVLKLSIALLKAYEDQQREKLRVFLLGYIAYVAQGLQQDINAEIAARKAAITQLRQYILKIIAKLQAQVNAIIPTVNKSAASGYNSARPDQSDIITTALDDILKDNPAVRDLIGKLVSVVLDLATIDDPLARLAANLILTQVIDRLGVDKLAGGLISDLLGAFLGMGPPQTLQDVTTQTAQRLAAGERQWQQFYANGGNDIENLGSQMRESANPVFTLAMAAFFGAAVVDPAGTATVTDAAVTPAVEVIAAPIIDALGAL